jgi:DNA ligase 1
VRRFIALYVALDATTKTGAKQQALEDYFRSVPPQDAAWAAYFLTGRKFKRLVKARELRDAALQLSGTPEWLFEASHEAVGDLAETIALLLPPPDETDSRSLTEWVEDELAPLAGLVPEVVRGRLAHAWQRLDSDGRFVHVKLITGAFRIGVAKQLVVRALSGATGVSVPDVAQRLAGDWSPSRDFIDALRGADDRDERRLHRPYPFFLAHPLDVDPSLLGPVEDWQAEWKWDGIRAQIVVRRGTVCIWSRGEELVNDAFPELVAAAHALPEGTVIDGEVLAWNDSESRPHAFSTLQKRLNRKAPGARLVRDTPLVLCAYDLLEQAGGDIRAQPLIDRRTRLESLLVDAGPSLRVSPLLELSDWKSVAAARAAARDRCAEGLMLKRRDSPYGVGRVRGAWWKWKVDPFTVDAVLVYAEAGHGRRASLFTDYTFAVWDGDALVPFAKAYSGLTDEEIRRVDAWVRAHTLERFGPVRRVEPALVFELAFEGLQLSPRHKSGIAVRFPRIARWRTDKAPADADTLATLKEMAARS